MKTLREIYNSYKHLPVCDKGTTHSYIEKYEEILAPYRDRPITLVEIGVESGGSLAMWAEYFANPLSRIIGIDIADRRKIDLSADARISFIPGDGAKSETVKGIDFVDIVIDDANHTLEDQTASFNVFFPKMRKGGLYVIEDILSDSNRVELMKIHPFKVTDLRHMKQCYCDILMIATKN